MKKISLVFLFLVTHLVLFSYSLCFARDLRDVTVGININDIPQEGYTSFYCVLNDLSIENWVDFAKCDVDIHKNHVMSYEYDDKFAFNENFEGTQVAGHPVKLTLFITSKGIIDKVDVKSDPKAPMYFRKQAHLLWIRVRGRYGANGWQCEEFQPKSDELKIGKYYINRLCKKSFDNKEISVKSDLYMKTLNDNSEPDLISKARMIITRIK